ncbi:hypothetical protein B0T21DRAFT_391503 [Apiosordaria backusii]|uniref:Uncharacterized protein n=1 Tax=Apiosordaria backusii TaxID=314023 RepID=A0AA40BS27_9PEZI|nr:hypothetical protein B0T21DRAFT_391503 [Apiosordaria backusii]
MIASMMLAFLPMLIQLAIAGPVERATKPQDGQQDYPSTGCISLEGRIPDRNNCHRVIDTFSQSSKTGLMDIAAGNCITIGVNTCSGFICNYQNYKVQVNMAKMAIDMTVNIFNRCVLNDQYGQWAGGDVEVGLIPTPPNAEPPAQPINKSVDEVRGMVGGTIPAVDGRISQHP